MNLCFQDFAAAAYTLCHALNKWTRHKAIVLRSSDNVFAFPGIAEMRDYDRDQVRKIVHKADVIIFHSAVAPVFEGLELDPKIIQQKRQILYCHGTELRTYGDDLFTQAEEILKDWQMVVSTPDLLLYAPQNRGVKWLPVIRSVKDIRRQFSRSSKDEKALQAFVKKKKKVILCHAPTSEEKKGSATFYRVITKVVKTLPGTEFLTVHNQSWDRCLMLLAGSDVYFDADPPFISSYGCLSIESAIFKHPVVTKITQPVIDLIKKETGLPSPFITFANETELLARTFKLAEDEDLRQRFGRLMFRYARAVHDEKPVLERFNKILEGMPCP